MVMLFLWIFILILWIVQLVLRLTTLKGSTGNNFQIGLAIFWILLAVINISIATSKVEHKQSESTVVTQTEIETNDTSDKANISEDGIIYYTEGIY